jgi:hypothetical protein
LIFLSACMHLVCTCTGISILACYPAAHCVSQLPVGHSTCIRDSLCGVTGCQVLVMLCSCCSAVHLLDFILASALAPHTFVFSYMLPCGWALLGIQLPCGGLGVLLLLASPFSSSVVCRQACYTHRLPENLACGLLSGPLLSGAWQPKRLLHNITYI